MARPCQAAPIASTACNYTPDLAKARGQHMGRPPKLTPQQQKEARRRRAQAGGRAGGSLQVPASSIGRVHELVHASPPSLSRAAGAPRKQRFLLISRYRERINPDEAASLTFTVAAYVAHQGERQWRFLATHITISVDLTVAGVIALATLLRAIFALVRRRRGTDPHRDRPA